MKKIFLSFAIFLFICQAYAQTSGEENEPMVTDRPSQSNSAKIVPPGTIQLEVGFSYFKDKTSSVQEELYQFPTATLRIGVLPRAELRLNANFNHTTLSYFQEPELNVSTTGLALVSVGTKIQLLESNGDQTELALQVETNLPVGNEYYKPNGLEPKFRLAFKEALTDKLSLHANLGMLCEENEDEAESRHFNHFGLYTLVLDYSVTEKITVFGEAFGGKWEDEPFEHGLDAGFAFSVTPDLQLDAFGGFGLTDNAPDYFIETGISYRLKK